jgi:hypothetical protein
MLVTLLLFMISSYLFILMTFVDTLLRPVMQLLLVASRLSVSSLLWFNFLLWIYLYSGLFLAAFMSLICACNAVAGCFNSEFWYGCYVHRSNQLVLSFSLTQWGVSRWQRRYQGSSASLLLYVRVCWGSSDVCDLFFLLSSCEVVFVILLPLFLYLFFNFSIFVLFYMMDCCLALGSNFSYVITCLKQMKYIFEVNKVLMVQLNIRKMMTVN